MEKYIELELKDNEWDYDYIDHDREIVRSIVVDNQKNFYFAKITRNDIFANGTFIETAGGGVEQGEELEVAIKRELKEELGIEVEIITKLGLVSDYYNLIHRHNLNHYFLCRIKSFGSKKLTNDEKNIFNLSTIKLDYQSAINEYKKNRKYKLGRLLANREVPILKLAMELINALNESENFNQIKMIKKT